MNNSKTLEVAAADLSTSGLFLIARTADGKLVYTLVAMKGQTKWHGGDAFDLELLPEMFEQAMQALKDRGYTWDINGTFSLSVRQHDMVLVGADGRPLIPSLSWRFNLATEQVAWLRNHNVEATVGRIEERFILPKLMFALEHEPSLRSRINQVMTTGDYIGWLLTGQPHLSTSDALSNGLLEQNDKSLAVDVLQTAGFCKDWFPYPVQSGTVIGTIRPSTKPNLLHCLSRRLEGWKFVATLGDNHAGAVGLGLSDDETVVVSAGSSGTVVRRCKPSLSLAGNAACFEYYTDRLLLMMLNDCTVWYDRFLKAYASGLGLNTLNGMALDADSDRLLRVRQKQNGENWEEFYPDGWGNLSMEEMVASTQLSIAAELVDRIKLMFAEVTNSGATTIKRIILTGGLSQSAFFRQAIHALVQRLGPTPEVFVSGMGDEIASQAAAHGALINSMVGNGLYDSLEEAIADCCPLKKCDSPRAIRFIPNEFYSA